MKEPVIIQSPHIYDPFEALSEEERKKRYCSTIDAKYHPYTVIDVLQKVFHRDFARDLLNYIAENLDQYKASSPEWTLTRISVNNVWRKSFPA